MVTHQDIKDFVATLCEGSLSSSDPDEWYLKTIDASDLIDKLEEWLEEVS